MSAPLRFSTTVRLEDVDVTGMSAAEQLSIYLYFVKRFGSGRLFDIRHPEVAS